MDEASPTTDGTMVRTVEGPGATSRTVRGSEFIAYVDVARNRKAAEAHTETVGAEHPEASHVVPAYRVRRADDLLREYASDDGEPRNSAGAPVLGVLQKQELENVVVAVVRYFGGTELGVGGLSRAYADTAGAAIEAAGIVERPPRILVRATVEYDDSGTVRSVLDSEGLPYEAAYESDVVFEVTVPVADRQWLEERLASATSGRVTIEVPADD